jgi:hypothetical protein
VIITDSLRASFSGILKLIALPGLIRIKQKQVPSWTIIPKLLKKD